MPVKWVSYPEPLATRRVVLNNKQREKTPGQQAKEALVLEETARKMANERQGKRTDLRPNWDGSDRWDEDVAGQIGISKNSVRRGTDVYRMAYPDEYVHDDLRNPEKYDVSEEVREVAQEVAKRMEDKENTESFHGAWKEVKTARRERGGDGEYYRI